jgi:hypothetical protein
MPAPPWTRRALLSASTGLFLPLPYLGSLQAARASAPRAHPLVIVRAASGVAQQDGEEPERFWPRALGAITPASLEADADRATSELARHAADLLLVRGTRFPFKASRELHAGGGNQLLTAARPGPLTNSVMTYALGESIDNFIARHSPVNGGEPLTLYAGRRDNYGEEVLSYRGPLLLRGAESDPWRVYQRLTGASGGGPLRVALNDLVLDQLQALRAHPRLSYEDRLRLDLHTTSVRELEVMACRLEDDLALAMEDAVGLSAEDDHSLSVARLHCDLIALALSCDAARAVTLQIGDRLDRCRYVVKGQRLPTYHELTHRLVRAEDLGRFRDATEMHEGVNRLHLQVFAYLLDRLRERELLESSVTVFCSDVATGSHRYDQIPWILAGRGDGLLKPGRYVDAGDTTHDRLLVSLLHATGHAEIDGQPVDRFGDESLAGGPLDVLSQA